MSDVSANVDWLYTACFTYTIKSDLYPYLAIRLGGILYYVSRKQNHNNSHMHGG